MADEKMLEKEKMLYNLEKTDIERHTNKGKRYTKQSTRCLIVGLIVLNVVLLIALLTLVLKWRMARQIALEPREQTVCIPCQEMGISGKKLPDDLKGKISRKSIGESEDGVCCGYTSTVLNQIVSEAIKNRDTGLKSSLYPLVSKECKHTTKVHPSAQINGISVPETGKGNYDVIMWDEVSETSFLKGGITYKNGKFTIKETGYYYVFSQLMFIRNQQVAFVSDVTFETTPTRLDHFMFLYSNGTTRKILEGSKSSCEIPSTNDETTSTIGAVFYLEVNDKLFVNTSHPENLVPSREGNHFGLYLT